MNSDDLTLWTRCREGDEAARNELILLYRPLAIFWARKISMIAGWANTEDLAQIGVIGLMKAIEGFDPSQGAKFKAFARGFIRGAIFDSSEFTRDLARRQREIYRRIRRAEEELTQEQQRIPTIEEVADKTGLTIQQIQNAIDAVGVASARELTEGAPASRMVETRQPERTIMLMQVLSHLSAREQEIIRLYYWEDQSHEQIAQMLGLTPSNVVKIRQRAIKKLGKLLDVTGR
jgi:RNA polymerase sigma factor (sigma-70 family)